MTRWGPRSSHRGRALPSEEVHAGCRATRPAGRSPSAHTLLHDDLTLCVGMLLEMKLVAPRLSELMCPALVLVQRRALE